MEFLARLLQHIPPLKFKAWRQYGAYSVVTRARWRAAREADGDTAGAAEPDPAESPRLGRSRCTSAWAALLSRTWGFDPLECPDCGGRLEIVTAIHDPASLERITRHYGLDTEVPALKPARAPPWHQQDLGGPAHRFDEVPNDEFDGIDPPMSDEDYIDPPVDDGEPVFYLS